MLDVVASLTSAQPGVVWRLWTSRSHSNTFAITHHRLILCLWRHIGHMSKYGASIDSFSRRYSRCRVLTEGPGLLKIEFLACARELRSYFVIVPHTGIVRLYGRKCCKIVNFGIVVLAASDATRNTLHAWNKRPIGNSRLSESMVVSRVWTVAPYLDDMHYDVRALDSETYKLIDWLIDVVCGCRLIQVHSTQFLLVRVTLSTCRSKVELSYIKFKFVISICLNSYAVNCIAYEQTVETMLYIQGGPKMAQFFWYALFHCQNQEKMCNNTITNDPITNMSLHYLVKCQVSSKQQLKTRRLR